MAAHIPGARLVELSGADHLPWVGKVEEVLNAIETFLADLNLTEPRPARLATVLCVDALDAISGEVLDWGRTVAMHRGERISGREDVLRAVFDGPVRAIRCACGVWERAKSIGRSVRLALHAGQLVRQDDRWSGPALTVAEQVLDLARPGEVIVSATVKNLVVGSGIQFADTPSSTQGSPRPAVFNVLPESVALLGKAASRASGAVPERAEPLTRRQRTIVELIAQGLSNREIANLLCLSEHTVHRHLANIFDRLGVTTRAAAVARMRGGSIR